MDALTSASGMVPLPWLDLVREMGARLRFGVVQLVAHDGRVTPIEFTEKTRLPVSSTPPTSD